MALVLAVVGALLWVLYDFGLLSLENYDANVWLGILVLSIVLGVGLSWSHVRRVLSGEEAACREAEELIPEIVTAAVKVGLGRSSAISLAAPKARALIEEKIQEAVASYRAAPWPPLVWEGPFELEKRFFFTDEADVAVQQPGAERVDDQTVRFRGDEIRDIAYR